MLMLINSKTLANFS